MMCSVFSSNVEQKNAYISHVDHCNVKHQNDVGKIYWFSLSYVTTPFTYTVYI